MIYILFYDAHVLVDFISIFFSFEKKVCMPDTLVVYVVDAMLHRLFFIWWFCFGKLVFPGEIYKRYADVL